MAKMFYSLEEAAAKLGKSADDVKAMADRRELEVFRDRDRLMFKVEQVDLLAGSGKGDDFKLAESGELEPLTLASSGSGAAMAADAKEQTGASIFDLASDGTDESDPSAVTRVTPSPSILSQDPGKSGSGLLDLTRGDIDETALGVTSLEDAYSNTGSADASSVGSFQSEASSGGGGQLFESAGADAAGHTMPMMAAYAEPYDGPGSGFVGGLALGMIVATGAMCFAVIAALASVSTSSANSGLLKIMGENLWPVVGGFAGIAVVAAVIGWLIGKKS